MKNKITILLILAIAVGIVNFIWLISLQNRTSSIRLLALRNQAKAKEPIALPEKLKLRVLYIVDENGKTAIRLYSTGINLMKPDGHSGIMLFNDPSSPFISVNNADGITNIESGWLWMDYDPDSNYEPDQDNYISGGGISLIAGKDRASLRMRYAKEKEEVRLELDDYGPMLGVFNRFDRDDQPTVNLFDK